eukprot:13734002-Ditylum_brightwellii.AAC.1
MPSNKWNRLFDHSTNMIIADQVPLALQPLNNELYNESMGAFNTKTRAPINARTDLFNNGIKLLWTLYKKFTNMYNILSLQQAINKFQCLQCNGSDYTAFASKTSTM